MAEDLILILSIVVALGIGLGGGLLFAGVFGSSGKRARELEEEVEQLKQEQVQYKDQVSQHFQKTANLFQDMTEQYRNIYTHLAEGAEQLCSDKTTTPALDLPEKPRLAKKPENEDHSDAERAAGQTEQPATEPTAATGDSESKPDEKKTSSATDDDNMLGDAPNIPDMPGEADKTKIH